MTMPPCDCTVRCGDDARVHRGEVEECGTFRIDRLTRQRYARIDALLHATGHRDVVSALEQLQQLQEHGGSMNAELTGRPRGGPEA